jgi:hypothetical protein
VKRADPGGPGRTVRPATFTGGILIMAVGTFDRDEMARHYAARHLRTDPGIAAVIYLPGEAPEREIRFVEVNELIADRAQDPVEPIDFGVDVGGPTSHKLMVVDVTPAQWERIDRKEIPLPSGWSLDGATPFTRR